MKSVIKKLPWAVLALTMVIVGCAGQAGQMKESVEKAAVAKVLSVAGEELPDRVRLTIDGSAPLTYTVFRLSEPLRLIVDLADTDVTGLGDKIEISLGNVTSVVPEQFDEAAGRIGRIEIGMSELWDYETSRTDNQIIIDFMKPVAVSEAETAPAEAAVAMTTEIPAGTPEVVELTVPGETAIEEAAAPDPEQPALAPATVVNKVLFYEENGHFSMELVGDGSLGKYDALNLTGPARLVVDLWGVSKGFKSRVIPVEMSGVDRIRVGEHPKEGKLRFVLDLKADTVPPYVFEARDDRLVVTLGVEGPSEITVKGTPEAVEQAAEVAPAPVVEPAAEVASAPVVEPAAEIASASVVEQAAEVTPAPVVEQQAAPEPEPVPIISDIRYRTEEGGGAVLIIADSPVEYSVSQPDSRHLIVDLDKVGLPTLLVRSQDTRDIGGPLLALSSFNPKGANGARVSLTYEEGTQFQVEQSGVTLTVVLASPAPEPLAEAAPVEASVPAAQPAMEETPAKAHAAPEAQAVSQGPPGASEQVVEVAGAPKYTGDLMTLDFKNADILNVLRLIAEVSGLNIITGDNVGGKISMRMVNVPWDQALDVILKTKGLGQIREGNVVRIAPIGQIEKERNAVLTAKKAQEQVEELILKIVPLSYASAGDIVSQLTPFLSPRGSINTDTRTNALIVKDVKENIKKIEGLVAELDVATPQVRIEARIVIVDESWSRNLGIKWGAHAATSGGTEIFGNAGASDASYGGGDFAVNLPAASPTSVLGVSFGSVGSFTNLDLRLSAMEQANKGKIISSPTLMVIQNQEASIEVNNPFPENRTSTSVGADGATTTTSVSFSDIWTKLKITPQVTSNDDIFMDVSVEKDSKGQQASFGNDTYTGVNSHKLDTKIIVRNNGTAVIGGVYTESKKDGNSSVPFLSKLPLLGNLFKNSAKEKTKEELLIFINASIVKD